MCYHGDMEWARGILRMQLRFVDYRIEDRQGVRDLIDDAFVREDALDCLAQFPQYGFLALRGEDLIGVSVFTGNDAMTSFTMYVRRDARRAGIGTQIVNEMQRRMKDAGVQKAMCDYVREECVDAFAAKHGYRCEFSSNFMRYRGGKLPAPEADIAPYRDEDYDRCQRIFAEAFHKMRVDVGMESELALPCAEDRESHNARRDDIFVLRDGGEIVGALKLDGAEIDAIAVQIDRWGKGYGRQLCAYAVNALLDRGVSQITLWAVEGNPAKHLYEKMGFVSERLHAFVSRVL